MKALAKFCVAHRRTTVFTWIGVMIVSIVLASSTGADYATSFDLPDTDSAAALDLLENSFPDQAGDEIQVVFRADEGTIESRSDEVDEILGEIAASDVIAGVAGPDDNGGRISEDGKTLLAPAQLSVRSFDLQTEDAEELLEIAEAGSADGLQVELGGDPIRYSEEEQPGVAEMVGLIAAVIVLLITFGSVIAMGLPIGTAVIGLATALSLVTLLTHVMDVPDFSPQLAAMIGLGVGIDYALFIVTRYRSGLSQGLDPTEAVVVAMDTAGRAVLFAGVTVCIALLGLFVVGADFLYGPAVSASITVLVTMIASVTLLPALLSKAGRSIDRFRLPGFKAQTGEEGARWSRWSRAIQARPWLAATGGTAFILVLAIPVFSIDLGSSDAGNANPDTSPRKAYDLLSEGFGPGFNGPLLVVSDFTDSGRGGGGSAGLAAELAETEGVAEVGLPFGNPSGTTQVIRVTPSTSPQSQDTSDLVDRIRTDVLAGFDAQSGAVSHVGGQTAVSDDFATYVSQKMPPFMAAVIILSALLLLLAFRSILVPLKAIVMNLISIGAAFGVVVAVFQFGWGNELLGLEETAPIEAFLPVFVFAIIFGLSMDYEVFLMSRVHEEWVKRGDPSEAVVHGVASTGRVITAAATIMICVFASFAFGDDQVIKLFGVGLASAIAIDAFVIRSLLVPAVMELMGEKAWWLPAWLDKRLPQLRIESEEEIAPAPSGPKAG